MRTKIKAVVAGVFVLGVAATVFSSRFNSVAQKKNLQESPDAMILTEIAGYQQWQRVNDRPLPVGLTVGSIDLSLSNLAA